MDIIELAAANLGLPLPQVKATARLLAAGDTVPFISRYRKEVTGNLDEIAVHSVQCEIARLTQLFERRDAIVEAVTEQGAMTPELLEKFMQASTMSALEDLYLPYRPRRRTRATIARERGLEPLARMLMSARGVADPHAAAARFVKGEVSDTDAAIDGAADIMAEWISESPRVRNALRGRMRREAVITASVVKGEEHDAAKFMNYDGFSHSMRNIASHQYLALRRAEAEGLLKVSVKIDDAAAIEHIASMTVPRGSAPASAEIVGRAVADGYKRLLKPSIENEIDAECKERADKHAISLFSENLRQLLLAAPLHHRTIAAIDPGFRTGCKVVAINSEGDLLDETVIYPNEPRRDTVGATRTLMKLISDYDIDTIALGDRTASRETEAFLRNAGITDFAELFIVSENGASVYSASELAREEFPDKDVTVRGAVSIGRRLIDPLAELVKIDPKSIGVGQYQHDVDQNALRQALDFTVEGCVNMVGVDLNTASPQLLGYIAGIGKSMARKIVEYRRDNGAFQTRDQLMKVPRLGAATYRQAAGFLRVPGSSNPLDNTGIHPESYHIVQRMATDLGVDVSALPACAVLIDTIDPARYADCGTETVADIISELRKPGRDPREEASNVDFDPTVRTIDDLAVGMILPGKVGNITAFGAFVDIGIKENGLLHVSQMSNKRGVNPSQIVKINQKITVRIIDLDLDRRRISLSIKDI